MQRHKRDMAPMALAIVADNPVFHDRCNFFAPFAAVEDAIMANFRCHMIFFERIRQSGRNVQRSLSLPKAAGPKLGACLAGAPEVEYLDAL